MNPEAFLAQVNGGGAPPAGTSQGAQAQQTPAGHQSSSGARMWSAGATAGAWVVLAIVAIILARLGKA